MNITFRPGAPADAADFARIHTASWLAAYSSFIPLEFIEQKNTTRLDLWNYLLTPDSQIHELILLDDTPVGITTVDAPQYDDLSDDYYELHGLYLDPPYFRQGIGAKAVPHAW